MKKAIVISFCALFICSFSVKRDNKYYNFYSVQLTQFNDEQHLLLDKIKAFPLSSQDDKNNIKTAIAATRIKLKNIDFWLRYFEPIAYKKINGPLPVEWENEVFEKFEKPYKREGAGLSLAELYLEEQNFHKDSLARLIQLSIDALPTFQADSIVRQLDTFDHFFLCNRLYLLNLAALYTTGFECPGTERVIPELRSMVASTRDIYLHYNEQFTDKPLTKAYFDLYDKMISFVNQQPADINTFDHFTFIKDYVNPLFAINQQLIRQYGVRSESFNDYTLNNNCNSVFDKSLYTPQNTKGIYSLVKDEAVLSEIRETGRLLFYDPILSGNNSRSCVSCHKPKQYFTDTSFATSLQFDGKQRLARNTPSLVNVIYNHLIMLDGKHTSLQDQGKGVMTNHDEMSGSTEQIVEKVLSCKEYKNVLKKFLKYTPEEKEITFDHIVSAITLYYGGFSSFYSPFDEAMNNSKPLSTDAIKGFNLFMGKAQCGTCHYVPQFNGVPPPYIGSEFEVIGVPGDKTFTKLSEDKGRYDVNPASETMHAFRTGTVRNAQYTKPYMHNGIFTTLDEVIDFYNAGGGAGKKLTIDNQTLSADSLKLTASEKNDLIAFINSLSEKITFEDPPGHLPLSTDKALNARKVGGEY